MSTDRNDNALIVQEISPINRYIPFWFFSVLDFFGFGFFRFGTFGF